MEKYLDYKQERIDIEDIVKVLTSDGGEQLNESGSPLEGEVIAKIGEGKLLLDPMIGIPFEWLGTQGKVLSSPIKDFKKACSSEELQNLLLKREQEHRKTSGSKKKVKEKEVVGKTIDI